MKENLNKKIYCIQQIEQNIFLAKHTQKIELQNTDDNFNFILYS